MTDYTELERQAKIVVSMIAEIDKLRTQNQALLSWVDAYAETSDAEFPDIEAKAEAALTAAKQAQPSLSGCACRWGADDKRVATCVRHQGWLDVVQEWADRARAAEAQLAAAQGHEPDMFWNHDDPERPYSSIDEFLNHEICNGTELEVGHTRTIQRAIRLPNIEIRITAVHDEECEADYEVIAAAPQPKETK